MQGTFTATGRRRTIGARIVMVDDALWNNSFRGCGCVVGCSSDVNINMSVSSDLSCPPHLHRG